MSPMKNYLFISSIDGLDFKTCNNFNEFQRKMTSEALAQCYVQFCFSFFPQKTTSSGWIKTMRPVRSRVCPRLPAHMVESRGATNDTTNLSTWCSPHGSTAVLSSTTRVVRLPLSIPACTLCVRHLGRLFCRSGVSFRPR